jgi:hypothetical protein
MKQGFLSSGLTYPFLTSTATDSIGITGKQDIYLIMKGLQGLLAKCASKTVVFRGFNGFFPFTHVFQPPLEAGAPCTFAEGMLAVLIGDVSVLESTLSNLTSVT